jgi:glycosyltransferase involved in cell wall biosynthesis
VQGIAIHRVRFLPAYPFHVHLHSGAMRDAFWRAHVRERFDLVHLHTPLPPPFEIPVPNLLTFHTPVVVDTAAIHTNDLNDWLYRLQTPVAFQIEKRLVRSATKVSAVSASVAGALTGYGINPSTVSILPNGIDTKAFPFNEGDRGSFLLCTGRLGPRKGHRDLIAAAKILSEEGISPKIIITGKGPSLVSLAKEAKRLGVDQVVEFRGFVSRAELLILLQKCRLFVFPTHYEGLPTSVLEAMASGAPIVSTKAPGVTDLVVNGMEGCLARPQDPADLARVIRFMLQNSEEANNMARRARAKVEENFSWAQVSRSALSIYEAMAAGKGKELQVK